MALNAKYNPAISTGTSKTTDGIVLAKSKGGRSHSQVGHTHGSDQHEPEGEAWHPSV